MVLTYNTMKTILGFFCSFFLMNIAFSQKLYLTDHPIYLDVINQYIQVYSKKDSSILTNKGDQDKNYIKVFDLTPRGSMKFIFHDTSSKIIVFGHYKEALKLSKPKGYTREGPRVRTKQGGIS